MLKSYKRTINKGLELNLCILFTFVGVFNILYVGLLGSIYYNTRLDIRS